MAIKNIGHNINKTKDKLPIKDNIIPKPTPKIKVAISGLLGKYFFIKTIAYFISFLALLLIISITDFRLINITTNETVNINTTKYKYIL